MGPNDRVKYLGMLIGPTVTDNDQWQPIVTKFNGVLGAWSGRALTFSGKITVLKTLALSTLYYVASVVPASPATVTAIDRACWRFLWSGKRDPIARNTVLLPRQHGGLGAPDFPSIISSLQLQWLRRLLDDNTRGVYKSFMWADLLAQPFVSKWGLGRRALLAPTAVHPSNCDPFWRNIVTTAADLHLNERPPSSLEDVQRQHLFHNNRITYTGAPLSAPLMARVATDGIVTVADAHLLAHRPRHHSASLIVKRAVPHSWRVRLRLGPTAPVPGDWFVADKVPRPTTILHVTNNDNGSALADTFTINRNNNVRPLPSPRSHLWHTTDHVRAHVAPLDGVLKYRGYLHRVPLIADKLSIDQRNGHETTAAPVITIPVHATTAALTSLKTQQPVNFAVKWPQLQLPWKRVLRWIWSPYRDRHINDLLFKIIHHRLPIGERRQWDPDLNVACPCGNDLETLTHLFVDCPVARSSWTWFFNSWRVATGRVTVASTRASFFASVPPAHLRNDKAYWRLFSIAQPEMLYCIWLQRCRCLFDDQPYSSAIVVALFKARLISALSSASSLASVPGFLAYADALYDAIEATPL